MILIKLHKESRKKECIHSQPTLISSKVIRWVLGHLAGPFGKKIADVVDFLPSQEPFQKNKNVCTLHFQVALLSITDIQQSVHI